MTQKRFNELLVRNVLRFERYNTLVNLEQNAAFKGHLEYECYLIKRRLDYLIKSFPEMLPYEY